MKRMTATPFSLNSARLEGKQASDFIQNTTSPQTASLNITGSGTFGTNVYSAAFDAAVADSELSIGTTNATTITIGADSTSISQNIQIGTGDGNKFLTLGSKYVSSSTLIQGGYAGVRIETNGGFAVQSLDTSRDNLLVSNVGDVFIDLSTDREFRVRNSADNNLISATDAGAITLGAGTGLFVQGTANFYKGITIDSSYTALQYTTPNGFDMSTMINIPNYTVSDYSTILAFGLPATSSATARGLLVSDARTGNHQATIGILSPNESAIFGMSWNGSNTKASLSNTASSIALQGNNLDLLTATNNGGNANIGIGNDASAGYALDVTGTGRFSGTVVATGGLQTSTIDTASAGALTIGSTNATSVNIAKNTTITGQSGSQALTLNQTGTSSIMQLQHNGTNVLNVANNGGVAIQLDSATNSDFSITNQSGAHVFNVDTSNGYTVDNGTTSPDNLLENPSFESNGPFQASGWTNTDGALTITTTNPHTGLRALAVPAIGAINATKTTKWYTAEPGEIFYGEVWARVASGTNGTAAMQISYFDSSKTFLSFSNVAIANSTTYTKYTLNGTAPANTAYITISPRASADSTTGTWYFDDLYFAKVSQKQSLKLQDTSGTVQVSLNSTTGSIQGSSLDTATASTLSIGSATATSISIGNASTTHTNTLYGQTIVKSSSDGNSTIAFQLQRADGTSMFTADSIAQTITIGNAISGDKMVISTENGQVVYYGSARRTKKITLNAEYTGSVLDAGTGSNNSGLMTSSMDLSNRMNYYKWTTSQATNQSYDVVVQVPIPTDFDGWASSNPLSIASYTSDTTNGTIKIEARDSSNTVRCDFISVTPVATNAWATNNTGCTLDSGTYTAGDYMTLRVRMQSPTGGNVRVGAINLSYLSKY